MPTGVVAGTGRTQRSAVRQRLAADTLEARALIDRLLAEQVVDPGDWDRDHLGAVAPPDPE